ncbi:carbohydrate ABC transporter permease [Microbacterium limosum]|uniref:Carbohydrate ABC transporter permease n=1 Tax=Microbacterium limosum TaxID=3079935 RepID=A0AAU0MJ74_9MICO|nr:carbohydrate ABC transporter permease [Microbacterium sp. Y20]WOQ70150.1 carbohydrate ABC transporter permease [Microbacterium sp. Y20]
MLSSRGRPRRAWLGVAGAYTASAILVIPIYWLLVTSIRQPAELQSATTLWPTEPNFEGYASVLGDAAFGQNLINSLIYGAGAAAMAILLGAGLAYALARSEARWTRWVLFGMLVLQTFPGIMLAIPLFVMFSQLQLIDSRWAVVIALATKTVPFTALMLRPYFQAIPVEVEHAAWLDGATRLQTLVRVVLPLTLPGLVTVSAFNFVAGWGDLLFSITLLTDPALQPISVGLYRYIGQYAVDWNQLMAASVIASIPAVAVFFFAQRFLVSGTTAGATNE